MRENKDGLNHEKHEGHEEDRKTQVFFKHGNTEARTKSLNRRDASATRVARFRQSEISQQRTRSCGEENIEDAEREFYHGDHGEGTEDTEKERSFFEHGSTEARKGILAAD